MAISAPVWVLQTRSVEDGEARPAYSVHWQVGDRGCARCGRCEDELRQRLLLESSVSGLAFEVQGRLKSLHSIKCKMMRKQARCHRSAWPDPLDVWHMCT
eukprot:1159913-Prorocentrum_minimum.AAC.5